MKGYKPDGADFNFVCNGYACAVGVNTDNLDAGGGEILLIMTKQKSAGGPTETYQDWEMVHPKVFMGSPTTDPKAELAAFLIEANEKLMLMTGGVAPEIPAGFLEALVWYCRFGLAFDATSSRVVIK